MEIRSRKKSLQKEPHARDAPPLQLTTNDWQEVIKHVDIATLLSLRQTSAFFLNLVDNNDQAWEKWLPRKWKPVPTLVEMAKRLQKTSTPTISKTHYIVSKILASQGSKRTERMFAAAYDDLLTRGNLGLALFVLPFILQFFFSFSRLTWLIICNSFALAGCVIVLDCTWKHAAHIWDFKLAAQKYVSWRLIVIFAMHTEYYHSFHPLHLFHAIGKALTASGLFIILIEIVLLLFNTRSTSAIFFWLFIAFYAINFIWLYKYDFKPIYYFLQGTIIWLVVLHLQGFTIQQLSCCFLFLILLFTLTTYIVPGYFAIVDPPRPMLNAAFPRLPSSSTLFYVAAQCLLPVLCIWPLLSSQVGDRMPVITLSNIVIIFFGVYKLMCFGDYRWYWISWFGPAFSTFLGLFLGADKFTFSALVAPAAIACIVGSMCHTFVWVYLIGYIDGTSAQFPRLETMLHYKTASTFVDFCVQFQKNFFVSSVGSASYLFY